MLRIALSIVLLSLPAAAQIIPGLTIPPSGGNQKASVTQHIGPVGVTIEYSSPAVHGPDGKDRRGEIWGKLVPYGLTDLGFGNGKPAPWRAGANENTVFAISDAVSIEGKSLPAGRYGLHMIAGPEEWTLIFSKDANAWGSFYYEAANDVLRVAVKPHKHEYREWLTYEFTTRKPAETVAELQWEELAVPWTIKVDNIDDVYISKLKENLSNVQGFGWRGWVAASQFCLSRNTHLEQALEWAEIAVSKQFIGEANFTTLSNKAAVLDKLGRKEEAAKTMQLAVHHRSAGPFDLHQYGRRLITEKKNKEALEIFLLNSQRNGDEWPVHVGLARGYAANGDSKQALEHARKALTQAPDPVNKQSLEAMVATLEAGKPVVQ
jgi:tetratricopeptide (TPR) repeat protein